MLDSLVFRHYTKSCLPLNFALPADRPIPGAAWTNSTFAPWSIPGLSSSAPYTSSFPPSSRTFSSHDPPANLANELASLLRSTLKPQGKESRQKKNVMANIVYVLTGGNRGIGLGLVKKLLTRPATTVVASVRNEAAAATLKSDAATVDLGDKSGLHIMILDFSAAVAPSAVRDAFTVATAGTIDRVDVLVANAAMISPLTPSVTTTAEDLRASFEVNAISPLLTFQGLWPLMDKPRSADEGPPKFIAITSSVGSIECLEPVPGGAYGPSKAALNWITKSLHLQHEDSGLVSVAVHPGWVQTDAGRFSAKSWGYEPGPPDTIEDSVDGVLKVIDEATRETTSGKFVLQTGQIFSW